LVARGELVGHTVEETVDGHRSRLSEDATVDLLPVDVANLERERDVLSDRLSWDEGIVLEDHCHVTTGGGNAVHAPSIKQDITACRLLQAGDHAQQSRLPAPGRPDKHEEFLVFHGKRQVVDQDNTRPLHQNRIEEHRSHTVRVPGRE
jgi:hypothetical protein